MTLPSTLAMRSSSSPDGARMACRATSSGWAAGAAFGNSRCSLLVAAVWAADAVGGFGIGDGNLQLSIRERRRIRADAEAAMSQRRKTTTQFMLLSAVDFGDCKARPGRAYPAQDVAPRIDDH